MREELYLDSAPIPYGELLARYIRLQETHGFFKDRVNDLIIHIEESNIDDCNVLVMTELVKEMFE